MVSIFHIMYVYIIQAYFHLKISWIHCHFYRIFRHLKHKIWIDISIFATMTCETISSEEVAKFHWGFRSSQKRHYGSSTSLFHSMFEVAMAQFFLNESSWLFFVILFYHFIYQSEYIFFHCHCHFHFVYCFRCIRNVLVFCVESHRIVLGCVSHSH